MINEDYKRRRRPRYMDGLAEAAKSLAQALFWAGVTVGILVCFIAALGWSWGAP